MEGAPQPAEGSRLDNDELLTEITERFKAARNHSAKWREEAEESYDFVAGDGKQWSEEDKAILREQMRPVIEFNRISPVIEAVAGSEVSNRQEVRYIPRQVGDTGVNDLLTGAAQWVRDECDAEDEESDAFLDTITCGMGWTETRLDYEEDQEGQILVDRIDPMEMYWDPSANKRNLTDAQYLIRIRKWARSEIEAMWPDADIEAGGPWESVDLKDGEEPHDADEAPFYDKDNNAAPENDQKGKIAVVHYQAWKRETFFRVVEPTTGQMFELPPDKHATLLERMPAVQSVRQTRRVYYQAFVCGNTVLETGPLPCQHDFTFQCVTGKRDRNANIWYGLVRGMKDPQRWANKWLSQTLHIMNSNSKGGLLAEDGAFKNPRKAEEDWADQTSVIHLNSGGLSKVQERQMAQFPAGFFQVTEFAVSSVRDTAGVNLELLGMADRQQAGVLEYQRKQAGLTILSNFFDSLRRYRKRQGRVLLYFIQQYISDGRLVKIAGEGEEQYVPLVRQPDTIKYDIIVDDAPTSPNQKERVFQILSQLLPTLQKQGIPIPPEVLDYSPLPASLAAKWKSLLQPKEPPPPNPMQQAQLAKVSAETQDKQASAAQRMADAAKTQQDTQLGAVSALVGAFSQPPAPGPQPVEGNI